MIAKHQPLPGTDVWRIVLVYAVVSSAWVILSDFAVRFDVISPDEALSASILKGLLFVLVTSALLWVLMWRSQGRIKAAYRERLEVVALLEAVSANASDAIFAKDIDGRYTLCNETAARNLGKTPSQIIGRSDYDLFPHEIALGGQALDDMVLRDGTSQIREHPMSTPDGARMFQTIKSPLRDEDGTILGVFGISRDITELASQTEGVRNANAELAATLQAIPDLLFDLDERGTYCQIWARNPQLLARQRDALIGHSVAEVLPPDAADTIMAGLREAGATGTSFGRVIQLKLSGEDAWFELSIAKKAALGDPVQHFIVLSREITARKKDAERVAASEGRLRLLLDHAPAAVAIFDASMRYIAASRRWSADYGLGDADLTGRSHYDVFPDIPEHWRAIHRRGLAGEIVRSEGERFVRANGNVQWLRWEVRPWEAPDGKVGGIVLFSEDTTSLKVRDDEILRSAAKFKVAIDSMADAVFIVDLSAHVVEFNSAFVDLHRFKDRSECPSTLDEFASLIAISDVDGQPLTPDQWPVMRGVRGETATGVEVRLANVRNGSFWIGSVSFAPLRDVDGNIYGCVAAVRDITEQKAAQAKIASYVKRIEGMMRATLQVVANAAEKRDPYTAGHEYKVGLIAKAIARELGWPDSKCDNLELIGLVHDIGKVGVPAEILAKPTRLSVAELELVRQHVVIGYEILKGVEFPEPIAEIIYQHHERLDGSGYPRGLKGDAICAEARVIAVADVLESMSSHRPYRPALGLDAAMRELEEHAGTWFDDVVVGALLRLIRQKGYTLPH